MTTCAKDRLLSLVDSEFSFRRGQPLPLGATPMLGGINFAIFSSHATAVTLALFAPGETESLLEFPLDARLNRTGSVWHVLLRGLHTNVHYAWRMDMRPNPNPHVYRYDPDQIVLDPYARAVSGGEIWAASPKEKWHFRRSILPVEDFDWEFDQPLNIPLADSIIYELHVRGFTRHPSSGAAHPGTFAGLTERIPHLVQLGVTAVELMPVNEFEEADSERYDPVAGEKLLNLWGYQPIAFFAPNASYSSRPGEQVREFKEMVKRFHAAGIEVILDVVFNHTAEGDQRGPTWSFRGIDNAVYYLVNPVTGAYENFSGCGNTFNCNHPVVRQMIRDCLRYWVMEMHVDGFRFDLASILGRGQDGSVLSSPPLLESLAYDPVLAQTKLIAEAWDAAGLYQVGTFPAWGRWAEWNGKFRDDVRRFVKGDPGMVPALATRLAGSPDLYQTSGREPYHSINLVTCHDGFSLADLVAYNEKHNERNGEQNRDGASDNYSWNCGAEGPADDPAVNRLRRRQMKNFAALLILANGVPMIYAGDEFGRTQQGNNNAYCQDNEISWVDWRLKEANADLFRFFCLMINFRRRHPVLRRATFRGDPLQCGPEIRWHGVRLNSPDWSWESRSLAMEIKSCHESVFFIANAYWEPLLFELPPLEGHEWRRFADTSLDPPQEICLPGTETLLPDQHTYLAGPRSTVILLSKNPGQ